MWAFLLEKRFVVFMFRFELAVFSRFCFASGSPDNIKIWKLPDGNFLQNFTGHQAIVNTLTVNSDGVMVSGGTLYIHVHTCTYMTLCMYNVHIHVHLYMYIEDILETQNRAYNVHM